MGVSKNVNLTAQVPLPVLPPPPVAPSPSVRAGDTRLADHDEESRELKVWESPTHLWPRPSTESRTVVVILQCHPWSARHSSQWPRQGVRTSEDVGATTATSCWIIHLSTLFGVCYSLVWAVPDWPVADVRVGSHSPTGVRHILGCIARSSNASPNERKPLIIVSIVLSQSHRQVAQVRYAG